VELTVWWKAWENDKTVFPPFPQTLEIAWQRFPHSHRRDDDGMNISLNFNSPGGGPKQNAEVGQTSLPNASQLV
jgi:hypothetical protein